MPSITRILQLAPAACYLSANEVAKGSLFGKRLDESNPLKIYNVYKVLKKIYDNDPTYDGLQVRCDYLYELMKRYALRAAAIVDGGSGGSVAPVTPSQTFPIYITQDNFEGPAFYRNANISGNNIAIFLNQINRYLLPAEFSVAVDGISILIPGFNAEENDYELVIEKVTIG